MKLGGRALLFLFSTYFTSVVATALLLQCNRSITGVRRGLVSQRGLRNKEVHSKLHSFQASLCTLTASHSSLIYVCTYIRLIRGVGMIFFVVRPKSKLFLKFAALLPQISQTFAALEAHYSPNLPHTCRTLSSLRKVRNLSCLRNFDALNRCLCRPQVKI